MYQLVSVANRIKGAMVLGVTLAVSVLAIQSSGFTKMPDPMATLRWLNGGIAVMFIIGWVFVSRWRWFWARLPILNQLVFPDVSGEWKGKIRTNWDSALQKPVQMTNGASTGSEVLVDVRIEQSFFGFSMHVTSSVMRSHSLFMRAEIDRTKREAALLYVYRAETASPVQTDEREHLGAGRLQIYLDAARPPNRLTGRYWTDRSWRSGINTAGLIELTRPDRI